ncbi:MAG: PQQ-binding-like beta-propeller repeat protein, partial [Bythopirellula sp.]
VDVDDGNWTTFAGNQQRTNKPVAQQAGGAYEVVWSRKIANEQRTIFPVVASDLVVYQDDQAVYALNLSDGRMKFNVAHAALQSPERPSGCFGQPCYTLTVADNQVFGVINVPLGSQRTIAAAGARSTIWGLDLSRDGALAFRRSSGDLGVSFTGAPVVDQAFVYVPVRSNDVAARAGIACYSRATGEQMWQRWLCRSNTPATGKAAEIVNNLLTCDGGIIYANTNLGVVAAVHATNGRILWLHTYERRESAQDEEGAYYRNPSPCVYHHGKVYVLPTDSNALLALDAGTGAEFWNYPINGSDSQIASVFADQLVLKDAGSKALDLFTGNLLPEASNEAGNRDLVLPDAKNSQFLAVDEMLIATGQSELSVLSMSPGEPDAHAP